MALEPHRPPRSLVVRTFFARRLCIGTSFVLLQPLYKTGIATYPFSQAVLTFTYAHGSLNSGLASLLTILSLRYG